MGPGGVRIAERRSAARIEYCGGVLPPTVRVRPGRDVVVVNLSTLGLLVEGVWRLRPNGLVDLLIAFGTPPLVARGRVLRCYVAAIDRFGAVRYRAAIELTAPISVEPPPDLQEALARLTHADPSMQPLR